MKLASLVPAIRRRWRWVAGAVAAVALLLIAVDLLVDEPLRRAMEREVNERLEGYTLTIGRLDFHVLGFSLDLLDATLVQDRNPEPPVASFPELEASVQWRELLSGRLVANFRLVEPRLHVNRAHLRQEAEDETPVEERGWQEAVQAIYPLKLNELKIVDGRLTYIEDDDARPLDLSRVNAVARNIRNIHSPDRAYPSPLSMSAVVFETGRLEIDGHADFLKAPYPGVNADIVLEGIPLDYFTPVISRYNFVVERGALTLRGRVEYAPTVKIVDLAEVTGAGIAMDYVHAAPRASEKTKRVAKKTAREAQDVANEPGVLLRVGRLALTDSTFGYVNRATKPDYRVFIASTDLTVENLTNHLTEGTATATLTGRFMGAGDTTARATFRPETAGPNFDLDVSIEDTQMPAMNKLLRAYGNFDVVAGLFSFFAELRVKDRRVAGYVKPLFRNLDVYDPEQEREEGVLRKVYEKVVGAISGVLENRPREEVATQVDVSGPLENPDASTLQVILRLIQNAFFKAILPGFERELGPPDGR